MAFNIVLLWPMKKMNHLIRLNIIDHTISKNGKTFSMDFCIGNKDYLEKGMAVQKLDIFIGYSSKPVEPEADTSLIAPFIDNLHAIHAY